MATTNTTTTNAFNIQGVKFSYCKSFILHCGGIDKLKGLTTTNVKDQFILELTKSTELSVTEHLLSIDQNNVIVGKSTYFISHAWKYNFLDVISSLDSYFTR
jgi:hypothetical protein